MSKRIIRPDSEWMHIIQECRQSGLSDAAWCEQHDIRPSTFYNAVTRLRGKACAIPEKTQSACVLDLTSNHQDVVQIGICPGPSPEAAVPAITAQPAPYLDNSHTIELSMGDICLRISNSADPVLLEHVLRTARAVSC